VPKIEIAGSNATMEPKPIKPMAAMLRAIGARKAIITNMMAMQVKPIAVVLMLIASY
jgi:hypothetical protein